MAHGDIETVKIRGKWRNVIVGSFETQEDAAAQGRAIASMLHVEWFLRGRNGRWRLRNTYTGRDPRNTPG